MDRVIDTNIAVIANGREVTASVSCQIKAIEFLEAAVSRDRTVIDAGNRVLGEYRKRLKAEGQPGVGDQFFRHLLDNQGNTKRIRVIDERDARGDPLRRAFAHGNLSAFDPSDRPFAICSAVGRARVVTATDSDWLIHEVGLQACGVRVEFICGKAAATKA
ncbi:MAG: hypothetical protein WC563_16135 [Brevundimonas sp.]|jgi:hypothetical protein